MHDHIAKIESGNSLSPTELGLQRGRGSADDDVKFRYRQTMEELEADIAALSDEIEKLEDKEAEAQATYYEHLMMLGCPVSDFWDN